MYATEPSYLSDASYLSDPSQSAAMGEPVVMHGVNQTPIAVVPPQRARMRVVPNEDDIARERAARAVAMVEQQQATAMAGMHHTNGMHGMSLGDMQWGRFAISDASVVVLGALAGVAAGNMMKGRTAVSVTTRKAYLPVLGALGGLALSKSLMARGSGLGGMLKSASGTLLAAAPLVLGAYREMPIAKSKGAEYYNKAATRNLAMLGGASLLILAIANRNVLRRAM